MLCAFYLRGDHHPASAARTPSITYCTASAASSTPSRREATTLAVTPSNLAIRAASAKTTKQSASTATMTASRIASRVGSPIAAAGKQDGGGDRAGTRHQRNGERESGDVAHMLFERLLGLLRLPLDAHAEHHFRGDREQQQAAGDAEGRQTDRQRAQQPVADQRAAGQDRRPRSAPRASATLRRARWGRPWVIARYDGTRPTGSTTTTRVTSAEMRNSTGMRGVEGTLSRRLFGARKTVAAHGSCACVICNLLILNTDISLYWASFRLAKRP